MQSTAQDAQDLLIQLEASKQNFDPDHSARITNLLTQLANCEFIPHQLIRFHESLLFLRAFPHSRSLIPHIEKLLNTFYKRIEKFRASQADMSLFDDFDTSGIVGTTMRDILSFDVVRWLVRRIPRNIEIAWDGHSDDYWDDYQSERARGSIWPRFIPLLEEDADVEANIPWQRWLDAARGKEKPLPWLIHCFERLQLSDRHRAQLYDSLHLPIRWNLENLKLSRTRNWFRPHRFYFHDAPLIQRSEVSLTHELSQAAPKFEKLSLPAAESVMHAIRDVMVVRYRELYGTTLGDPHTVVRADLGRGVVMHFWGLPPDRRLPIRAYVAGYTLKNGVPINYIEAIGLCEWIEVGFNTFYTYRQGETAWIYAQALRCLCALTDAKCISIYPYQIGQNNDEAIDSGAFWFYRKLGFRSGRADLQKLCKKEEQKIAANRQHKTPARILKRLAEAHMFYDVRSNADASKKAHWDENRDTETIPNVGATVEERPFQGRVKHSSKETGFSPGANAAGPWDSFSTRNLGLLINRRMSRHFNGDSRKIRKVSTRAITRALKINLTNWTQLQIRSLENWSLILSQIPNLTSWTPGEKHQLIKIIRAKSAPNELPYLHQTQHHPRLRAELLRLGSQK